MPHWNPFHGWMAFDDLDEDVGLTQAFTIGYRFTDDRGDEWTRRFNGFKAKQRGALRGGAVLMGSAVPGLLGGLGFDAARTAFVPALSSGETVASEDGVLCRLTRYCAQVAQARFVGDAITKKEHERLHKFFNADRRREILDDADFRSGRIEADNILVFDDFITRGNTLSHIAQALLASNQRVRIYGVALAKTERLSYHRERFGRELSNDHVPQRWERTWREGERE